MSMRHRCLQWVCKEVSLVCLLRSWNTKQQLAVSIEMLNKATKATSAFSCSSFAMRRRKLLGVLLAGAFKAQPNDKAVQCKCIWKNHRRNSFWILSSPWKLQDCVMFVLFGEAGLLKVTSKSEGRRASHRKLVSILLLTLEHISSFKLLGPANG